MATKKNAAKTTPANAKALSDSVDAKLKAAAKVKQELAASKAKGRLAAKVKRAKAKSKVGRQAKADAKAEAADKPTRVNRTEQVLALLKKQESMTTADVRKALEMKAVFGTLARMRDAGLIEEFEVEGQRGSTWSMSIAKK